MAGLGRRSHYRKHLTDAVLHDLPEPDESAGQRIARVVGTRGGNMFDVVVALHSSSKATGDAGATDDACKSSDEGEIIPTSATDKMHGNRKKQSEDTDGSPPIRDITSQRTPQLAFLPTKFRKLVWIKRNDFVIVDCGEEEDEDAPKKDSSSGGGFRYVISHILYKEQVKHIKSKGLWPSDPFFADDIPSETGEAGTDGEGDKSDNRESDLDGNEQEENEPSGAYEENGIVFDDPLDDEMMVNTNRIATLRVEDSSSDEDSD
ncbi:hypothetical protein ACHAXT_010678 [Thalassiosira profunda]